MSKPSRSRSLREPGAGQRSKQADQETLQKNGPDQPTPARQHSRTPSTSTTASATSYRASTGASKSTLSRTKSVSIAGTRTASSETDGAARPLAVRKSFLPAPRRISTVEGLSRLVRPRAEEKSGTQTRQLQYGRAPQEPQTIRQPATNFGPEREAAKPQQATPEPAPTLTAAIAASDTQKEQNSKPVPPISRLERSTSLRQPTAGRGYAANHSRHRSHVTASDVKQTRKALVISATDSISSSSKSAAKPPVPTFPQQLSPRKASKPSAPVTQILPTGDTRVAPAGPPPPSHVGPLQLELLQLQLLHTEALQAKAKWQRNAEGYFRDLHESTVSIYRSAINAEKASQRVVNANAVEQWLRNARDNNASYDFAQQLQILSEVVQDITDLTDPQGGRYNAMLTKFEEWFERAVLLKQSRMGRNNAEGDETAVQQGYKMQFIDPLGDDWKEDLDTLTMKVELYIRELDCLDVPTGPQADEPNYAASALVRIVEAHRISLALMREELQFMARTEVEIVGQESRWISDAAYCIAQELDRPNVETRHDIPAWERM